MTYQAPEVYRSQQPITCSCNSAHVLQAGRFCIGCTPQACSYKAKYSDLAKQGIRLYGLSSQSTEYQSEAAQRLQLPYPLLSDHKLELAKALKLPTFSVEGTGDLIKRLTLIIKNGVIVKCLYPVFPSDSDVHEVLRWLQQQKPL